jgi:nicotinate dehydrogenase subunit B
MTGFMHEKEFSRKSFLKGGGALVVGFSLAGSRLADRAAAAGPGRPLDPGQVDSYLTVHPDNTVTLYQSVNERGQGTRTSLLQIAADELDIGMRQISNGRLDTATSPFTTYTGGSCGVAIGGSYVRAAAAAAKQALLGLASANLGVPVASLSVSDGVVSGGGKTVTYGQLVGGKLFNVSLPQKVQRYIYGGPALRPGLEPVEPGSKPISEYKLVTKPLRRVDVPDIVTGVLTYSNDVRLPGMLHGRVVRPRGQSFLGSLLAPGAAYQANYTRELVAGGGQAPLAIDESSIRHIEGAQVVHVGNFVGVVTPTEYGAIQAAAQLKVTWKEPATPLPGTGNLEGTLRQTQAESLVTAMGNVDAGFAQAAKTLSATYRTSYILHGPIGPHVAVADVTPTGATLFHQSGGLYNLAANDVAQLLGLPLSSVREISFQGSSFYGGISTDLDTPAAAALMSRTVGKPVRVQLMRWDDQGYDNYDAAEAIDVRAGVDANGKIVAFDYVSNAQEGNAEPPAAWLTGGIYLIPNRKVIARLAPRLFQTAPLRSPMDRGPAFATEQTIDELAYLSKIDPLEFRRQNMIGNDRWLAALDAVAKAAKWQPRVAASKLSDANVVTGRGFGFGTHVLGGGPQGQPGLDFRTLEPTTAAAAIAEIEVNRKTGKITVKHVYAATAPGFVANPRLVADQVMGTAIQGTSQALHEQVTFNKSNVTSLDWVSYPVLRFKDHPDVTPIVIQRLDEVPLGAGEEPITALFGSIANAFFDATGVRIRQVPMTPAVVRNALARADVK